MATQVVSKKQQKVEINKRPVCYLLLCANYNKDGKKIGLSVLDYSAKLENGHLDVSSLSNPVITFWLDIDKFPEAENLVNQELFSEVPCIVSGGGEFIQLHKLLTVEEYNSILALF